MVVPMDGLGHSLMDAARETFEVLVASREAGNDDLARRCLVAHARIIELMMDLSGMPNRSRPSKEPEVHRPMPSPTIVGDSAIAAIAPEIDRPITADASHED